MLSSCSTTPASWVPCWSNWSIAAVAFTQQLSDARACWLLWILRCSISMFGWAKTWPQEEKVRLSHIYTGGCGLQCRSHWSASWQLVFKHSCTWYVQLRSDQWPKNNFHYSKCEHSASTPSLQCRSHSKFYPIANNMFASDITAYSNYASYIRPQDVVNVDWRYPLTKGESSSWSTPKRKFIRHAASFGTRLNPPPPWQLRAGPKISNVRQRKAPDELSSKNTKSSFCQVIEMNHQPKIRPCSTDRGVGSMLWTAYHLALITKSLS